MRNNRWPLVCLSYVLLGVRLSSSMAATPFVNQCDRTALQAAAAEIPTLELTQAVRHESGDFAVTAGLAAETPASIRIVAHCEVTGTLGGRIGIDGQHYAIGFRLRLPDDWNRQLVMEGGGGTDGNIGEAMGAYLSPTKPVLNSGYAVVSDDSGHDNATNAPADKGGKVAFGFDPKARTNYGGASIAPVVDAAQALIRAYYGHGPNRRFFVGCSKGGQEGIVAATQYPGLFDGIVAGAPGFALPKTALAHAYYVQVFADVVRAKGEAVTPDTLAASFSDEDLLSVRNAVLKACDAADGAVDGIVSDFQHCTSAKVLPQLARIKCGSVRQAGCLTDAQIHALKRLNEGVHDSTGKLLYPGLPWDAGWSSPGWRAWFIGSADGKSPSIALMMGGPALATIFTTPPTAVQAGAPALKYILGFNFDRDSGRIYATSKEFPRSAWQDIGEGSADLDAFRRRGGRLLLFHGVSDAAFSITSTIEWYQSAIGRKGEGSKSVRFFAVPGMNHCGGGPATAQFDVFWPLVKWVDTGIPPDSIIAKADATTPWPDRTRPLCAFPKVPRKTRNAGDINAESSFTCR